MKIGSKIVVGWVSAVSVVGCGGLAHSLGGEEHSQAVNKGQSPDAGGTPASGKNPNGAAGGASRAAEPDGGLPGPTPVPDPDSGKSGLPGPTHPPDPDGGLPGPIPVPDPDSGTWSPGTPSACPCSSVTAYGTTFPGCCIDNVRCGVDLGSYDHYVGSSDVTRTIVGGCQPLDQIGVPDTSCQSEQAQGSVFAGCCRPDGTCGVNIPALGVGCIQEIGTGNHLGSFVDGGTLPTPNPAPDRCNYPGVDGG